jgi:tRNA(Ile)-lysidine synthase
MAVVRHAVRTDLTALAAGDTILIACSGGGDSVALAWAIAKEAPLKAISLAAVTIDHGLQPGSALRAAETANWLREAGYSR